MVEYIICYTYLFSFINDLHQYRGQTLCSVRSVWNLYVTSFLFLSFQSEINPLWVLGQFVCLGTWDHEPQRDPKKIIFLRFLGPSTQMIGFSFSLRMCVSQTLLLHCQKNFTMQNQLQNDHINPRYDSFGI